MPDPRPAPPPTYFACFDACRAVGMTLVLLVHAGFLTRPQEKPFLLERFLERADVGVPIFFVLSGFLLYRPFASGLLANRQPVAARTFLRRRTLRVIPGYWFALTVVIVAFGMRDRLDGIGDWLANYFLVFPYLGEQRALTGPIPQAWSISAEYVFYVMLPLLAAVAHRRLRGRPVDVQARALLVLCAAFYAFGQLFRMYAVWGDPSWQRLAPIWPSNWIDFFALGMGMAVLSAWAAASPTPRVVVVWLGRHPALAWTASALLVVGVCLTEPPDTPGVLGTEYVVRWFVYGLIALTFVLPAMFGPEDEGRIRAILRNRVLAWLGTISLGFYLFHQAVLDHAQGWTGASDFQANFYVIVPLTFVVTVALAALSYYAIERPFLRMKDRARLSRTVPAP